MFEFKEWGAKCGGAKYGAQSLGRKVWGRKVWGAKCGGAKWVNSFEGVGVKRLMQPILSNMNYVLFVTVVTTNFLYY